MPFVSTKSKDLIREQYDKEIIQKEKKRKNVPLIYFGLPGWKMLDVLEWRKYLGKIIAVERERMYRHLLLNVAFSNNLDAQLQLLVGDIDDILLKGFDEEETQPIEPTFDLVNLDYEGGILYKDMKGEAKRLNAIKKLFERQSIGKRDFLLLCTFNTRNRDEREFNHTLDIINSQLASYNIDAAEVIEWYKNARYDFKIKVYFPYALDRLAGGNRFTSHFYPPVTYQGSSGVRMIHFVCACRYAERLIAGGKSLVEIINLPMFEIKRSKIRKCDVSQIPL
jgi:hypothetical protein